MSIKKIRIIALLSIIVMAFALLAGCTNNNEKKTVVDIRIIDGSFKNTYALDEVPDYSKAKIAVTYSDGERNYNVPITPEMVSGLDTTKFKTNAVLTVSYKGFTDTWTYSVMSSERVDTSFRLNLAAAKASSASYNITVKASSVATVENGVYAISFTLMCTSGVAFSPEVTLKAGGDWKLSTDGDAAHINVVLYSESGVSKLNGDCDLIEVKVTSITNKGRVSVQSAKISDGIEDFVVPTREVYCGED